MNTFTLRELRKKFTLQKDQSDCGVACLQNILRLYNYEASPEQLREHSGTGITGTTMLGLCQAAGEIGLNAEGAEADAFENISEVTTPCILHLTIDGRLMHYVVYYPSGIIKGHSGNGFVIGDPAKGITVYTKEQLEKAWVTKACLLLTPARKLQEAITAEKKKWTSLWGMVKEDARLLYAAACLGLIIAVLNMSTAVFSQQLVDKILPEGNGKKVFIGIALFLFLLVIRNGINYLRQTMILKQGVQFNSRLTGSFFNLLLHLRKPFFDSRKTGDLTTRLNDTLRIQQTITYMAGDMALQTLLVLITALFIFFYNWKIGILSLALIPLVFLVVHRFRQQIIDRQRSLMVAHAGNESNYIDTIKAIVTIKNLNRQKAFLERAGHFFSGFQAAVMNLGKTRIHFNLVIELIAAIFLTVIISWSAVLVLEKHIKVGEMLAILQMSLLLFQNTTGVALATIQLQEAKIAFERMYEFTALAPEEDSKEEPSGTEFNFLSMKNVSLRFPGRKLLLEDISLYVKKGEVIAITGESGEGKSTIFQLLQRYYPKEQGEILLNGLPFETISLSEWRSMIGIVPQEISIISGTLLENILFNSPVGNDTANSIISFCRQLGFDKYFAAFPQGYMTILGEGGINLSGGQKQLLALARCLFHQPQLLLLDEPTAAMDTETEKFVLQVLSTVQHRIAIIIISHKDALTSIAHRVCHLQKGRLLYP